MQRIMVSLLMTDLLTPEEVREYLRHAKRRSLAETSRLCRDYLMLWKRNEELEKELKKALDDGDNQVWDLIGWMGS